MVVITSRGGTYNAPDKSALDFQEPYLRAIFGFVGIKDMEFINAQPMDLGPELQTQKIQEAQVQARELAKQF